MTSEQFHLDILNSVVTKEFKVGYFNGSGCYEIQIANNYRI